MNVFEYADVFLKFAQGLSSQQTIYRNHLIRVNQQIHILFETVRKILQPNINYIQHPNWQARNVVAPTQGPVTVTGQPFLRPEALEQSRTLQNLATRLTNSVLNKPEVKLSDINLVFNQLVGTFENFRNSYAKGPIMLKSEFSIPIRQIRDSLAWMNQYQQTAQRQAGQNATVYV